MSGIGEITNNNGNCLTCDSNIASVETSEKYFKAILEAMRACPDYADKVSAIDPRGIECTALPIRLRDLSQIKSDAFVDRQDHASNRAEYEARVFAAGYYNPTDPSNAGFYKNHMGPYVEEVKKRFRETNGKGVLLVSQVTFARLFPVMVNLLMKKTPDGTDNIVRRRKPKPDTEVLHEDGTVTREYYTVEEIEQAEAELRKEYNAENFYTLDVEYVPFVINDVLISAASLMSVKRTDFHDDFEFPDPEEIFNLEEETDPLILKHYGELLRIAKRDIALLEFLESRGGKIEELIINDCAPTEERVLTKSPNLLSTKEIYLTLLIYIKFIHSLVFEFIKVIEANAGKIGLSKNQISTILGTDLSGSKSPVTEFERLITDTDFSDAFQGLPIAFEIPEHMIRVLAVSIVRLMISDTDFTESDSTTGSAQLYQATATYFGYKKTKTPTSQLFEKFFTVEGSPMAIVDSTMLLGVLENKIEPLNSYLHRTASKYINDEGKFMMSIGIIQNAVRYVENSMSNGRKRVFRYDISNSDFVFSNESLINTVRRLTGFTNLSENVNPFNSYKDELTEKIRLLNEKRVEISKKISEKYGPCSLQYYIQLPPIPYNDSELAWFRRKCIEIGVKISEIQQRNPGYDWEEVRKVFVSLNETQIKNATSTIEDPLVINAISMFDDQLKTLLKDSGLDSAEQTQLLELESKLLSYSNPQKMEYGYENFEFELNKGVDLTMNYHLQKCSILVNGVLRSCQSLINDPNGIKIIIDYFDPFFRPFATVNTQSFDIKITVSDMVNKNDVNVKIINMAVRFGSTDNTHVCSKFRTIFYSIADRQTLLSVAKDVLDIPQERRDFTISDVPEQFILRWARTEEQNNAMQGKEKEKTYKFYDVVRGCNEMYPFYDSNGKRILIDEFNKVVKRYNESQEQREKRDIERKIRIEEERLRKEKEDAEEAERRKDPNYKPREVKKTDNWTIIDEHGNQITGAEMIRRQALNSLVTQYTPSIEKTSVLKPDDQKRQQKKRQDVRNNEVEIVESQKEELKAVFKTRRVKSIVTEGEWTKIVYNEKEIRVNLKSEPTERVVKTPIEGRGKAFKTPSRFDARNNSYKRDRVINGRNVRGSSQPRGSSRTYDRNTPSGMMSTTRSASGRSNRTFSQGSTPNYQRNPSDSPSITKRSGPRIGGASPGGESPHYLQLDRSTFNIDASNGSLAFYQNQPSSPLASSQNGDSLLPPSGLFDMSRGKSPSIASQRSTPQFSGVREEQTFEAENLDPDAW